MKSRFLQLVRPGQNVPGKKRVAAAPQAADWLGAAMADIPRDTELSPRDWAVFLLHTAAEIEHALLVQYLYAAYSIRRDQTTPGGASTNDWINVIRFIAQEEMGHLITVQNILHILGGPLNFDREDFPFRTKLYPFHFRLERFSKDSLAKYVAAEMPINVDVSVLSTTERDEIWLRAKDAAGAPINHVGELYRAIIHAVVDLPDRDFRTDRGPFQAVADEWVIANDDDTPDGVKVISILGGSATTARDGVLRALRIVARQGEGANPDDITGSHFKRFLDLYRAFPDSGFDASHSVGTNPHIPGDEIEGDAIDNVDTQRWARLFNVRYRILLSLLQHILEIPRVTPPGKSSPRSTMCNWVFTEMANPPSCVQLLARKLVQLPRQSGTDPKAGAPWSMPYTMAFPPRPADRWRLHLDLIDASIEIIREISDPPTDPDLRAIYEYELGSGGAPGRRKEVVNLQNSPL